MVYIGGFKQTKMGFNGSLVPSGILNIAIEHGPFIDDKSIQHRWCSIAMFNYHRVYPIRDYIGKEYGLKHQIEIVAK